MSGKLRRDPPPANELCDRRSVAPPTGRERGTAPHPRGSAGPTPRRLLREGAVVGGREAKPGRALALAVALVLALSSLPAAWRVRPGPLVACTAAERNEAGSTVVGGQGPSVARNRGAH